MKALIKTVRNFLFVLLLAYSTFLSAQSQPKKEYQVKAAFLYNFTQFVEWPASSFSTAQAPFVIGVLGENPFGTYLEETVAGEQINGHPMIVKYYKDIDDSKTSHVLFINLIEKDELEKAMSSLKGKYILTVTDAPEILKQEEVIRFIIKDNKVLFQINPKAAKECNLIMSSKLLNLAKIYGS